MSEPQFSDRKIVVLKVGGSVLTGTKSFGRVALFLQHRCKLTPSERLIVVVSAQRGVTDKLERQARRIAGAPDTRALDLLWSTGELRSVALLALHLQGIGISSIGLNVHETGLQLCHQVSPALMARHLEVAIAEHAVVIVPGFLVTRLDGAIVSLGRGGSDLSAVLLAIGVRASRCELVKDVPGYFEDDPHENTSALHLPSLSFEDALQMAQRGCELVQPRALLAAAEANLPLVIRSTNERATVSVISSGPTTERPEIHDEPMAAEA